MVPPRASFAAAFASPNAGHCHATSGGGKRRGLPQSGYATVLAQGFARGRRDLEEACGHQEGHPAWTTPTSLPSILALRRPPAASSRRSPSLHCQSQQALLLGPRGGSPGAVLFAPRGGSLAFHSAAAVARHAHMQRMRASLRFPRHTRSANALRTQRPYSWWRWICRTSSILSSSSLNCCWTYGEAGGGLLAVGDAGGGATGGGTNAGASARRPLPAAAPAGGGVPGLPSSAQAAHADALPTGEAPSMPWGGWHQLWRASTRQHARNPCNPRALPQMSF